MSQHKKSVLLIKMLGYFWSFHNFFDFIDNFLCGVVFHVSKKKHFKYFSRITFSRERCGYDKISVKNNFYHCFLTFCISLSISCFDNFITLFRMFLNSSIILFLFSFFIMIVSLSNGMIVKIVFCVACT